MLLGQYLLPPLITILLLVPRRYAPVAFLGGSIFIPVGASVMLGSITFTPVRILIAIGVLRSMLRRETPAYFPLPADILFGVFAFVALLTSFFHEDVRGTIVYHVGLAYDILGTYFLFRTWLNNREDVVWIIKWTLFFAIPLAVFMVLEFITGKNLFNSVGGIPAEAALRGDRVRARGPFRHAILAGTYGGVAIPLAIALWQSHRRIAWIGVFSGFFVVLASTSGGPVMTLGSVVVALCLWRYRASLRPILWWVVACLFLLHLIMQAPVWYLIARVGIGGGGYYRAKLIDTAIKYLNEWWLAGTDVTRHWMPSGVPWSQEAADITNGYLSFGVLGGLPLMLTFVGIIAVSFRHLVRAYQWLGQFEAEDKFLVWCLGASLFGHAVSMLAIRYFDQFAVLFYSLLAIIASYCQWLLSRENSLTDDSDLGAAEFAPPSRGKHHDFTPQVSGSTEVSQSVLRAWGFAQRFTPDGTESGKKTGATSPAEIDANESNRML